MQIAVQFLENLKVKANFDEFAVVADQPIRYKGDGTAPGPFDYFLASSALCAAYFVKVYCLARGLPMEDIVVIQDNLVDPVNRYKQTLVLKVEVPEFFSEKDREGIIRSIDRCTVKKTIQEGPEFSIEVVNKGKSSGQQLFSEFLSTTSKTFIPGKVRALEESLKYFVTCLDKLAIKLEITSWRNPVPYVWSVHIRDAEAPICFANGKGASKEAALCSALGEFFERLSTNYFYADYFLGQNLEDFSFVHFPNEKWFPVNIDRKIPSGLMDDYLREIYCDEELNGLHLIDTNSGLVEKGICALPFRRQSDGEEIYIPVNLIGNLFVSNGMAAGNTMAEAKVQALSEIFERAIKNYILLEELALPNISSEVMERYPHIQQGIRELEERGYRVSAKDASLGGVYPVLCVVLMNPKTGGVFASFGAHPRFEVALERSLTELLQGRSFEGLNEMPPPTFNSLAVQEPNNIIDHFIDSTGVVSWRFFSAKSPYQFQDWDFKGNVEEEVVHLLKILENEEKEVYIAEYDDFGVATCRILVPEFSEIYPVSDLVWDNNNTALKYRESILRIHELSDEQLKFLGESLEESGEDFYRPVSELIGVAFDENSPWGILTIGELLGQIWLALGERELAKEAFERLGIFNELSEEKKRDYQLLLALLEIDLDAELELQDYFESLSMLFGADRLAKSVRSLAREEKFEDLVKIDRNFEAVGPHGKLLRSYRKICEVRSHKKLQELR